jgi:transposase InsO family protein
VPQAILTDNGRVFTGRFARTGRAEVLFDRICRENGIRHLLTAVRSPTTTGKVGRFHRTLWEAVVRITEMATEPFERMVEAVVAPVEGPGLAGGRPSAVMGQGG